MDGEFSGIYEPGFIFVTFQNFTYRQDPVFVVSSLEVFYSYLCPQCLIQNVTPK